MGSGSTLDVQFVDDPADIFASSVSAAFVSGKWLSREKFPVLSKQAGKDNCTRMNTTDPIADYLTRLRNAIAARHKRVDIPASGLKRELSKILAEQKFINGFNEMSYNKQGVLRINLKYTDGSSAITGLTRISKPGLRVYTRSDEIPRVLNGLGVAVISTSRGLMVDRDARVQKIGGEILCHIW